MAPVPLIFTRAGCPGCAAAKARLEAAGIPYREISCDDADGMAELMMRDAAMEFPQIFVGDERIGIEDALARGRK